MELIRELFIKYILNKPCKLIKMKCKIKFMKIGKMEMMGIIKVESCNEL